MDTENTDPHSGILLALTLDNQIGQSLSHFFNLSKGMPSLGHWLPAAGLTTVRTCTLTELKTFLLKHKKSCDHLEISAHSADGN